VRTASYMQEDRASIGFSFYPSERINRLKYYRVNYWPETATCRLSRCRKRACGGILQKAPESETTGTAHFFIRTQLPPVGIEQAE